MKLQVESLGVESADNGSSAVAVKSFNHLPFTLERVPDVFVFLELVLTVGCFSLLKFGVPLGLLNLSYGTESPKSCSSHFTALVLCMGLGFVFPCSVLLDCLGAAISDISCRMWTVTYEQFGAKRSCTGSRFGTKHKTLFLKKKLWQFYFSVVF